MRNLRERLGRELLIMDGAMGTMLQARGLAAGESPERMNIHSPAVVREVYEAYLEAGSDIITANTFGANRLKFGDALPAVISAGVSLAREAAEGRAYVAASIGPLGKLLKPLGDLPFEEAYTLFFESAKLAAEAGTDLFILETFTDVYELKAALLAAKDAGGLPIVATMAFDAVGRLLTGADAALAGTVAEALGADAVGFNCGLGPAQIASFLPLMAEVLSAPIAVNPNAGLPVVVDGRTEFRVSPEEFAEGAVRLFEGGASLLGGCCGTTPAHIRAMKAALAGRRPAAPKKERRAIATSYSRRMEFGAAEVAIGDRMTPDLERSLREGDLETLLDEGFELLDEGADVLNVRVNVAGVDEADLLPRAVEMLQSTLMAPLMITAASPEALARAARIYNGRPILNGVGMSMDAILPIAKRYGALLLDGLDAPDARGLRAATVRPGHN